MNVFGDPGCGWGKGWGLGHGGITCVFTTVHRTNDPVRFKDGSVFYVMSRVLVKGIQGSSFILLSIAFWERRRYLQPKM